MMPDVPGPFRESKVHVLSEKCSTCVFRPGNLMSLRPGRLREIIEANVAEESAITCHQTLPYGDYVAEPAICRGYWDRYRKEVLSLKLAQAMKIVVEDEPPTKKKEF